MLHLVYGPMCSGKSSDLIRRAKEAKSVGLRILVINSALDPRDPHCIVTHANIKIKAKKIDDIMLVNTKSYDAVFIDEAQFFTNLFPFVKLCLKHRQMVYAYGLNGDFQGKLIGHMHELIPHADRITYLTAECNCERDAMYSCREGGSMDPVDVHASYTPMCRSCRNS